MILLATYFDSAFASRGCAMLNSLKITDNHLIVVLALDQEVEETIALQKLKNIVVVPVSTLSETKSNNISDREFFFSLTAEFCHFCTKQFPEYDALVYIDADMYFFQPVEYLLNEFQGSSVAFADHRHPWYLKLRYRKYGRFNVGINYFKNDKEGNEAIALWRSRCQNAINDKSQWRTGAFSDQELVDDFDAKFSKFKLIEHIGVNAAPWNIANYKVTKCERGEFYLDSRRLICFHFSNLIYDPGLARWDCSFTGSLFRLTGHLRELYIDYILKIKGGSIAAYTTRNLRFKTVLLKIMKNACKQYIYDKEIGFKK
jgi:hypothetical protein